LTSNTPEAKQRVIAFYDQEAARYIDIYRGDRMKRDVYPANDIRLGMLVERLKERGCRTILDIGCGSGGPLLRFLAEGFDAMGVDFSPKMVDAAREVLAEDGLDPERASHGDIERLETLPDRAFDAIVATGVFPHNLDDTAAYASVRARLAEGGTAFIEYRNALMSLSSLNVYSDSFLWNDLFRGEELPEPLRTQARSYIEGRLGTASAPERRRDGAIDYEEILARFHNPLTLAAEVRAHGFALRRFHWYHFHAAPPALEPEHRTQYWESSLRREDPDDWRGMFLCSAFVAELQPDSAA
jgi:SAM-dependent methyltransferase